MSLRKPHILLFCICSLCALANESPGGLLFTSSGEKVDKRTSLVLFGEKLQKFEDTFSVSFDLSVWDSNHFGHIFRLINGQAQEIEFGFVNFYGIDSMYLDFHSPITHKSVQIPITKEDIDKKRTLHLRIDFDLKADKASIALHDTVYTCEPVGLENPSLLQFAFGLNGLNLDVPQMLLKNLQIRKADGKTFFFPLNESKGDFARDETGRVKAPVKNPEWLVNKHFYWQAKSRFAVKSDSRIAYREAENQIAFVSDSVTLCYDPRRDRVQTVKTKGNDFPLAGNLLHSNIFCASDSAFYQFGGYGNHAYSNKISRYNRETQCWTAVDFKGDKITPRFYSAVGDGIQADEKLIFGGFGNETGKQEHGGQNLYDLYRLHLKQQTIDSLWRLAENPPLGFVPGNNLILSEDKRHFYALCYAHHLPKTVGYLYRFNLQNGAYDVMSDSIAFSSEDMNTSVNLFYSRAMKEFYAVIRDFSAKNETRVQIYSLLSPPITKAQLDSSGPSQTSHRLLLLLLIAIFAAVPCFLFLKKKNMRRKIHFQNFRLLLEKKRDEKQHKQSAIYLFGQFTVYDRKGIDISHCFGMKVKTMFSLILLETDGETGISSDRLSPALWPDRNLNETKNVRGVTVNRLRSALEDVAGVTLIHRKHRWFFVFEPPFYCDYLEYKDLLQQLHGSTLDAKPELLKRLIALLNNGQLLANVQDACLDGYKAREEEKLEKLLREYLVYLYAEKRYQELIAVSATYFMVEPINKEIVALCLKSYSKLGKNDEAKKFLKKYKRTYRLITGEDPKPEFRTGKRKKP